MGAGSKRSDGRLGVGNSFEGIDAEGTGSYYCGVFERHCWRGSFVKCWSCDGEGDEELFEQE